MVEGLQSRDLATRGLVGSWVHFATSRGQLHSLIAPLVRIILEQDGKRKGTYLGQSSDNGMKADAGKYYYSPSQSAGQWKLQSRYIHYFYVCHVKYQALFDISKACIKDIFCAIYTVYS